MSSPTVETPCPAATPDHAANPTPRHRAPATRGPSTPAPRAGTTDRRSRLPNTTASTPRPAALRNTEPRFSWSFTPSSTATVRARSRTCGHRQLRRTRRRRQHAAVEVEADDVGHHLGARAVERARRYSRSALSSPSRARCRGKPSATNRDANIRCTTSTPSAMTRPLPLGRSGLRSMLLRSRKSSRRGSAGSSTSIDWHIPGSLRSSPLRRSRAFVHDGEHQIGRRQQCLALIAARVRPAAAAAIPGWRGARRRSAPARAGHRHQHLAAVVGVRAPVDETQLGTATR